MLLVYNKVNAKELGLAFVNDNEAEVLEAVGYYHCNEKDYVDENGRYVEVWKLCDNV